MSRKILKTIVAIVVFYVAGHTLLLSITFSSTSSVYIQDDRAILVDSDATRNTAVIRADHHTEIVEWQTSNSESELKKTNNGIIEREYDYRAEYREDANPKKNETFSDSNKVVTNKELVRTKNRTTFQSHVDHHAVIVKRQTTNDGVEVPIAPSFTLKSTINRLTHNPERREIHVFLNSESKCQRPKLKGRLSGPSLTLLTWEHDSIFYDGPTSTTHVLIGKYQVPDGGTYFLELIALFCEAPLYHQAFDMTCFEDPANHTITARGASINVLPPMEDRKLSKTYPLGFWKLKNTRSTGGVSSAAENATHPNISPVYTRKQLVGCFDSHARKKLISGDSIRRPTKRNIDQTLFKRDQKECKEANSLAFINDYNFVWNNPSTNDVLFNDKEQLVGNFKQFQQGHDEPVCFMGMSHIRNMLEIMRKMHITQIIHPQLQYWLQAVYNVTENSKYVEGKGSAMKNYGNIPKVKADLHCSRGILMIGMWAASAIGKSPMTFYQYEERIKEIILMMRKGGIAPILRSLTPVTIGELGAYCPPLSWDAHAIDGYNEVLIRLSQKMNVPFIDLRFLTDPLWDAHADRVHPKGELLWRESNFIIRYLIETQKVKV